MAWSCCAVPRCATACSVPSPSQQSHATGQRLVGARRQLTSATTSLVRICCTWIWHGDGEVRTQDAVPLMTCQLPSSSSGSAAAAVQQYLPSRPRLAEGVDPARDEGGSHLQDIGTGRIACQEFVASAATNTSLSLTRCAVQGTWRVC